VVWIEQNGNIYYKGKITSKSAKRDYLRLRKNASLQFPYTAEVKPSESVRIEKQMDGYDFIRKANGIGGFLKASCG
jgi:uncharacterized protein YaiI (UPF0178 family)